MVFANQAIRKQIMQRRQRTKETDRRRRLRKLSRLSILKVPRKSPRKHLRVQVNDKIRVTVTSAPTWLLM